MWNDNDREDRQVGYPLEKGILFQEKESLFSRIILFRALPILMAVLSISCLFFGWIRIPDDLTSDLNTIEKYVSKGNSLLEKYLGTGEIAGIDTSEIKDLIGILSDGELTPYEMITEADTVQNTADSIRVICTKLKLESQSADGLEALADGLQVFRYLYFAMIGTGLLTILLILFRRKSLGNWLFPAAAAGLLVWTLLMVKTINEKMAEGSSLNCTIVPFVALLLSIPWVPYMRK